MGSSDKNDLARSGVATVWTVRKAASERLQIRGRRYLFTNLELRTYTRAELWWVVINESFYKRLGRSHAGLIGTGRDSSD